MSATPRIGTELAGYRLESLIERGGMSIVYLADHIRLGRKVALKILALELSEDDRFRERFLRESRQAASINHPNIIPIYDAGESEGLLYIAMLYVNGIDLKELIRQERPLDIERALSIVGQAGSALDAAHANGLVHRDVKPGNILVVPRSGPEGMDHVYLSDFGLTKHKDSESGITSTGQFVGTIDYVAPEQIEGNQVDGRVDIYSLGCVLYECLTGVTPFKKEDEIAVLWAHLREPPPSVMEKRQGVPASLDAVIAKAMAKSPDDRFASCLDFVAAARAAVRGAPGGSADTAAGPPIDTGGASGREQVVVVPDSTQNAASAPGAPVVTVSQPAPPLRPSAASDPETELMQPPEIVSVPTPTPLGTPTQRGGSSRRGIVLAALIALLVGALVAGLTVYAFDPGGSSSANGPSEIYARIIREHLPNPNACHEVSAASMGMSPEEVFGIASCNPGRSSGASNVTYSLIHATSTMQSMLLEPAAQSKIVVGTPMFTRASLLGVQGFTRGKPAGTCAKMLSKPVGPQNGFADFWSPIGLGHHETGAPVPLFTDVVQSSVPHTAGWVVCYRDSQSNLWVIAWSDNETHLLSQATGSDPVKLYKYWESGGGPKFGGGHM